MNLRYLLCALSACCLVLSTACDTDPPLPPIDTRDAATNEGDSASEARSRTEESDAPEERRRSQRDSDAGPPQGTERKLDDETSPTDSLDAGPPDAADSSTTDAGAPPSAAETSSDADSAASTSTRLLDLLFVVDNSGSMREEQASLRAGFPRLLQRLTQRTRDVSFELDVHLGVVSSDMGLAGVANNYPACNDQRHIDGGDDGRLQHPSGAGVGCAAAYPEFLSFQSSRDDLDRAASDFGCIATLGTLGCGFEQQLEAALKALWPKHYVDANGQVFPPEQNPIMFLSTSPEGRYGRGDVPIADGGNGGFLRNESAAGPSQIAIVIVTDEEDCSSRDTSHFVPTNDPDDPRSMQGLNLRCYYNEQNLFEVERYVRGYSELRPGLANAVLFGVIAGVPPDLVAPEARSAVDFTDPASRDAYYDRILADERMQNRIQNEDVPMLTNVAPSCTRSDAAGELANSYPPRRLVEVAKGLGENAFVQSICQDDLSAAMDLLSDMLSD